jgi:hypothetical protein
MSAIRAVLHRPLPLKQSGSCSHPARWLCEPVPLSKELEKTFLKNRYNRVALRVIFNA